MLFAVDASGSMAARKRMSAVSGAVLSLLRDAYQRRDKVGLLTFRGTGAEVVLPPTSSVPTAQARLATLRTGGRTPLADGLLRARRLLAAERLRDPRRRALLVVLTDGRATVATRPGNDPVRDACRAAELLAADGIATVVVDCEAGPVRLGLAAGSRPPRAPPWSRSPTCPPTASPAWCTPPAPRKEFAVPQGQPVAVPADGLTTRQRRNKPLLVVHTGEMKGKSTAAFGLALRGWAQGWSIGVFQFVKSAKWRVGEETAFRALGRLHDETGEGGAVEWHKMGDGWSWARKAGGEEDHAFRAREGWTRDPAPDRDAGPRRLRARRVHLPDKWGWVDVHEVVDVLARREGRQHVIVTGRDAAPELIEAADLVMRDDEGQAPDGRGPEGAARDRVVTGVRRISVASRGSNASRANRCPNSANAVSSRCSSSPTGPGWTRRA